jgi:enamine deaminase RidA (YjgF/YER057c/UK114 family)
MARAIGPKTNHQISVAVLAGDTLHATIIPVDLNSGAFVDGPIEVQARQTFQNLQALLREAGGDLEHVVHLTTFLVDANDLAGLNAVYREFFVREPYPARGTVVVRELVGPPGLRLQTTVYAYLKDA